MIVQKEIIQGNSLLRNKPQGEEMLMREEARKKLKVPRGMILAMKSLYREKKGGLILHMRNLRWTRV